MTFPTLSMYPSRYQGNTSFRPVHIGYDNMEKILEIKSIGNLNRQFVSLLRSEQEADSPIIGERVLSPSLARSYSLILSLSLSLSLALALNTYRPSLQSGLLCFIQATRTHGTRCWEDHLDSPP